MTFADALETSAVIESAYVSVHTSRVEVMTFKLLLGNLWATSGSIKVVANSSGSSYTNVKANVRLLLLRHGVCLEK